MLIWFTNDFDKSVAIDNRHVTSVYETDFNGNKVVTITTLNGTIQVKEHVLNVVARLNAE
jgi:hypothetical protein